MKQLTTQEIIQSLPFNQLFKKTLIAEFPKMESGRKFIVEQLLWDTYEALFQIKIDEKTDLAFEKAKRNEIELDENFYKTIRAEAEKEMKEGVFQRTTDQDLEAIRTKLQSFIKTN